MTFFLRSRNAPKVIKRIQRNRLTLSTIRDIPVEGTEELALALLCIYRPGALDKPLTLLSSSVFCWETDSRTSVDTYTCTHAVLLACALPSETWGYTQATKLLTVTLVGAFDIHLIHNSHKETENPAFQNGPIPPATRTGVSQPSSTHISQPSPLTSEIKEVN